MCAARPTRCSSSCAASPVPGGIAHAFNGSAQQALAFVGLGFRLGFGGAMTFERALQIRAWPLPAVGCLVLETDAPDIPPHWLYRTAGSARGRPPVAQRARPSCRASAPCWPVCAGFPGDFARVTSSANAQAALPRLARE
jgi:TatD DNase family protein